MSDVERCRVVSMLLGMCIDGVLPHGKLEVVARHFNVSRPTISRLWARALVSRVTGVPNTPELISRKNGVQNALKYPSSLLIEEILQLPYEERRSIRAIAHELNVSTGVIFDAKNCEDIRPHTNDIKPTLNDANLLSRVLFVLELRDPTQGNTVYQNLMKYVHVDKKWFDVTEKTMRCYLTLGEKGPRYSTPNKDHIRKVMFCALLLVCDLALMGRLGFGLLVVGCQPSATLSIVLLALLFGRIPKLRAIITGQ